MKKLALFLWNKWKLREDVMMQRLREGTGLGQVLQQCGHGATALLGALPGLLPGMISTEKDSLGIFKLLFSVMVFILLLLLFLIFFLLG